MNKYLKKKLSESRINNGRRYYKSVIFAHIVWNYYHPEDPWEKGYVIHHKDENPLNDDISNLQKMTKSNHISFHSSGEKCHFYRSDQSGKNNPMYGRKDKDSPNYGKHYNCKENNWLFGITGEKHPSYGAFWITNGVNSKFWKNDYGELPNGFCKGRKIK